MFFLMLFGLVLLVQTKLREEKRKKKKEKPTKANTFPKDFSLQWAWG